MLLKVSYGLLSDPIAEQAARQGVAVSKVDYWQKLADAVTTLNLQSVLTDADSERARKKLTKLICQNSYITRGR